jgi:transmembrane sensor
MMADTHDEQIMHTAADWWVRLRDPHAAEQTIEQWLAWTSADASHLRAFERITELAERLSTLGEVSHAQLVAEFAPVEAARRSWLPLAAAAAVVAMVSITGYIALTLRGSELAPQVFSSEVAATREITLADGTTVALGGATRLTAQFGRDQRRVDLAQGEAFFQVAHNVQRPFVVNVGGLAIHDVGTAFDVRRTGDHVTIAVTEGRVRIFNRADRAGDGLEAVAGQLVSYDPAHAALSVSSTDEARATAWRNDRLEFNNESLAIVVANINRYRKRPVRIADPNLEPLTFTGTVKTDAIDDWLRALPQVLPVLVQDAGGQTVLSDARRKSDH